MTRKLKPLPSWMEAFPLRPAQDAVNVVCESWGILTANPRTFHRKMKEPLLTKALKTHVERVTARKAGLLGMWAAENVINTIDLKTGALTEERRNDIVYGWNDDKVGIQLVFEFKKINKKPRSWRTYVGSQGVGRFVTGIYSWRQPVAVMAGMLLDPHSEVVPPLEELLETKAVANDLRIVAGSCGSSCQKPSLLFSHAQFDTDHLRPKELAPTHGKIRVAHIFLPFET